MLKFVATRPARRQTWQKHLPKLEQRKNPNFQPVQYVVVGDAGVSMVISALMIYAVFASGNWQAKENCLE